MDSAGGESLEHSYLTARRLPPPDNTEAVTMAGLSQTRSGWRSKAVASRARVSAASRRPKSRRAMS